MCARTRDWARSALTSGLAPARRVVWWVTAALSQLGWNSQPTAAVILEDVRVPAANLIGGEGNGFKIAMKGLDGGRLSIGTKPRCWLPPTMPGRPDGVCGSCCGGSQAPAVLAPRTPASTPRGSTSRFASSLGNRCRQIRYAPPCCVTRCFGRQVDRWHVWLVWQHLQFKLADMATDLQTARTLIRQAARLLDEKHPQARSFCAMAKRSATDAGFKVRR